jgi:hypothetical protein
MKKYFLRIASGLILVSLMFLMGCETDNSVTYSDEDRVIGTIHGVVTDANDNARMEDVVVKVVQKDLMYTTKTDSLGYYIVKNLYSGNYEATYEINGYAVSRAYGYIPTVEEVTNTKLDLNHSEVLDMDLFELNAGMTGKLYKIVDGNAVAASGVTVIADFTHFDLSPDQYTTTTNASGVYSFSNLPSAPMVAVRTLPYSDGTYAFDATYEEVSLYQNVTVIAPDMPLYITDAPAFVLTSNIEDGFLISDNIVMTFNKAIDTASFEVYLGIDKAAKTEINSVVWSNNNTTVTINPDENLLIDTGYYVSFFGKSVDGNSFDYDYYFDTQVGIEVTTTNLQIYDGYNQITATQAIIINFSMPVNTTDPDNYISFSGLGSATPTSFSWSNGDKTLTISAPTGNYLSGDNFTLYIGMTSTIANYDFNERQWNIHVE